MSVIFTHLPVEPLRITSRYGKRNTGIVGASTYHKGIDMGRNYKLTETPIFSVAKGKILKNYWNDTRGWVVVIEHGEFKTLYQHMKYQCPIPEGTQVKSGQQIGIMGSSTKTIKNMSTHLHFELIYNNESIDSEYYLYHIQKEVEDLTKAETLELIKEELEKQDKEPSTWAKDSWNWAKTNGLTDGSSPKAFCTREQLITILKRFYDLFRK